MTPKSGYKIVTHQFDPAFWCFAYLLDKPILHLLPCLHLHSGQHLPANIDRLCQWTAPSLSPVRSGLWHDVRPARSWFWWSGGVLVGRRRRSGVAPARGCRCSGPGGTGTRLWSSLKKDNKNVKNVKIKKLFNFELCYVYFFFYVM